MITEYGNDLAEVSHELTPNDDYHTNNSNQESTSANGTNNSTAILVSALFCANSNSEPAEGHERVSATTSKNLIDMILA